MLLAIVQHISHALFARNLSIFVSASYRSQCPEQRDPASSFYSFLQFHTHSLAFAVPLNIHQKGEEERTGKEHTPALTNTFSTLAGL